MLAFFIFCIYAAAPTLGHTVLLSRGTVVVHPDRIAATVEVCAEDFLHHQQLAIKDGSVATADVSTAAERYGPLLLDRLVIRDADGRRLHGGVNHVRFTPLDQPRVELVALRRLAVTYELAYETTDAIRFLTFQQRAGGSGSITPSQVVLLVRPASNDAGRMIVLTSAGNAETIDLDQAPWIGTTTDAPPTTVVPPPVAPTGPDRFKEIEAFVRRDSCGVFVDAYIPLVQLETFTSIPRRDADFLDPPEIGAAVAHLLNFFSSSPPAVFLTGRDDHVTSPNIERIALLSPMDARLDDAQTKPRRLGAWSARVAIRLRCPEAATHAIEWRLLNQAVMNATIYANREGRSASGVAVFPGDARVMLMRD